MKRLFIILIVMMLGVSACNTMSGMGKDIQKVGEKIDDAARKK
jgi:predicted small secreted protein